MLPLDGGGVVQQADLLVTHCCAPLGRISPLQQHQKGVLSALYAVPFPLTSLPAIGTRQKGGRTRTHASSDVYALVLLQVMATHGKQITAAALKDMVYTEAVVRLAET